MAQNNNCNYQPAQYNLLTGGASGAINNVAPSATSGVPVISQGTSAQPVYGTAVVAGGGTGNTSATAYALVAGGTTTTGAFQSVTNGAATSTVLIGNGTSALPSFSATPRVTALGIGATAGASGLTFDGTNLLANFAQGTFSPTLIGATSAGTQTYTIQVGRYQRVGRMVNLTINVATTANSGTGNIEIGALPFTTANNTNQKVPFAAYYSDSQTTTVVSLFEQMYASPNGTLIDTIKSIVAAGTTTSRAVTATASILVSGQIEV